jgi:aspartyl-tRNA(Asn)/glutamyl-tRNA(Gln) amidotransferase subunit B
MGRDKPCSYNIHMKNYTTIVGLEVHVELKTKSKMFCGCSSEWFGKEPNTNTCPVCLGLPGALPVPNKKAVEWTILTALALNCTINRESKFDRKHYFYPDLPKGYQISQHKEPIGIDGWLKFKVQSASGRTKLKDTEDNDEYEKTVRIRRVHLEEDTGKLSHAVVDGEKVSLVDFNRSGSALVEVVTEPDMRNSAEAEAFARHLHDIIRSIGVSDADMEKGTMRLEPNISVSAYQVSGIKYQEKELPKYKVEVKNINSFRFAKRAIDYEVIRHIELLEKEETPKQETRGWNEDKKMTFPQRSKEEAADYRYFPEPDIPPMRFTDEYIETIKKSIPQQTVDSSVGLVEQFGIRKDYAELIAADPGMHDYFMKALQHENMKTKDAELIASLIVNKKVDIAKVSPEELVQQMQLKQDSTISDESQLAKWVDEAIVALPQAAADFKSGKQQAIGALIGKVMQLSKGKADANKVSLILRDILSR